METYEVMFFLDLAAQPTHKDFDYMLEDLRLEMLSYNTIDDVAILSFNKIDGSGSVVVTTSDLFSQTATAQAIESFFINKGHALCVDFQTVLCIPLLSITE